MLRRINIKNEFQGKDNNATKKADKKRHTIYFYNFQ